MKNRGAELRLENNWWLIRFTGTSKLLSNLLIIYKSGAEPVSGGWISIITLSIVLLHWTLEIKECYFQWG